ncbi:maleylpyruvate isomerase N-terminal domain-containing protein [Nocardia asteroides]|uniref:maleylpyruvate isomerase N-terminal domain-containing protein n=1 Tax=Nocardia asteroides TaxID=1824 RepID=UPI001E542F68|nr:maleylpyruvate isomerase N-terminal domain-containing protein [Nocardia asteroides]UGT54766.1 maleylpyruvate isomerase N-terminal domain-containing protein [Nocardia asteroides]
MDVSVLHALTEDLAAFLSEVTQGDLRCPVPHFTGDLGDLYLHLVDSHLAVASAVLGDAAPPRKRYHQIDRESLDAGVEHYHGGAGLEAGYRVAARAMEEAFAATRDTRARFRLDGIPAPVGVEALFARQVEVIALRIRDVAQALGGLPYEPRDAVVRRIPRSPTFVDVDEAPQNQEEL